MEGMRLEDEIECHQRIIFSTMMEGWNKKNKLYVLRGGMSAQIIKIAY